MTPNQYAPNQLPLDEYTLFHFAWGAMMRQFGIPWWGALAASLAWEYWLEPKYKTIHPEIFPAPSQDTQINRTFDTAAVMLGWVIK